jgi:hypothetical protein
MSRRAIPGFVVVLAALVAIVVGGRDTPPIADAVFSAPAGTWMPAVTDSDALSANWFCPGVPADDVDGVGGEVRVVNRHEEPLAGQFTVLTPEGVGGEASFVVDAWDSTVIDVDSYVDAPFASVMVELDGDRGFVEQRVVHPAGQSVSPCADDTSSEWYLADGFTVDGSLETIIISNPYDDPVVADLVFSTESGESRPAAFQGFTVAPRSVEAIEIAELGARDEPVIATSIEAMSGRMVVGRAQHYLGGGRLGYQVVLAAPALRDQFWFANGQLGDGIEESYSIYNPTDDSVIVSAIFLGLPVESNFGNVDPITVGPREVLVFDPSDEQWGATIPDGRHAVVFGTEAQPAIVVERVTSSTDPVATTAVVGAPPRPDGFVASTWHVGIGPDEPTEEALVVYNVDNVDASVTVEAVGPSGPVAVPSLTDIPLGPGAVLAIDLTADAVLNNELIVSSTNRVFVERALRSDVGDDTRTGSWALPESVN